MIIYSKECPWQRLDSILKFCTFQTGSLEINAAGWSIGVISWLTFFVQRKTLIPSICSTYGITFPILSSWHYGISTTWASSNSLWFFTTPPVWICKKYSVIIQQNITDYSQIMIFSARPQCRRLDLPATSHF